MVPASSEEEPESLSRPAANFVYLERILSRDNSLYNPPAASTSSSAGPRRQASLKGDLVLEGSYISQVRMLEAIYSRARREASGAAKSTQAPAQTHANKKKPRDAHAAQPAADSSAHATIEVAPGVRMELSGSREAAAAVSILDTITADEVAARHRQGAPARLAYGAKAVWSARTAQQRASPSSAWSKQKRPAAMEGSASSSSSGQRSAEASSPLSTGMGVKALLDVIAGVSKEALGDAVQKVTPTAANHALMALGEQGNFKDVRRLVDAMVAARCTNEHTHGSAITALDKAGRFDMAIQHFEELYRRGVDIGPVCSSVLVKLCAQRRDLPMALDIFHRLSGQSTLNRFTYNCLIHLCAVLGQLEDALVVLHMMHEDGSPDTRPDAYTYAALLRAVAKSKNWKMLPYVYKEIQKSQEPLDSEVWCMLISTAGRANRPDLAKQFYQACKARGCTVRHVDNALMAALARHSNLTEMFDLYRNMLAEGLKPDEYTFNALLTTMCHVGASLYAVEDLVGEITKWGVKINTHLGTTLINAYKRSPEMTYRDLRLTTLLMEKAHDVLTLLAAQRQANSHTYGAIMAMYAQLGDAGGVQRMHERMQAAGVVPDGMTFLMVGKSCEDGGLLSLAARYLGRAETMGISMHPPEPQVKSQQQKRRGWQQARRKKAALEWPGSA